MAERRIICAMPNRDDNKEENCTGVIAHQISPRMITIGRTHSQRFSIVVNQDGTITATCPKCTRIHNFIFRKGAMDETGLTFEDIPVAPNPNGNPADPNDPNNKPESAPTPEPEPVVPAPEPTPEPVPAQ